MWVDAYLTAAYLLNRSPTRTLDNKVPQELWSGKAVDYSHLRAFGCRAWFKDNSPGLDKWADRAKGGIMVGYSDMGYLIWDPVGDRMLSTRDVTFDEAVFPLTTKVDIFKQAWSSTVGTHDTGNRATSPRDSRNSEDGSDGTSSDSYHEMPAQQSGGGRMQDMPAEPDNSRTQRKKRIRACQLLWETRHLFIAVTDPELVEELTKACPHSATMGITSSGMKRLMW